MTKQKFYDLLFEEAENATMIAKEFKKEMGPTNSNYRFHWGKACAICEVLRTMEAHLKIKGRALLIDIEEPLF